MSYRTTIIFIVAAAIFAAGVNKILTLTIYNPAVAIRGYRWLADHHLLTTYRALEHPLNSEAEGEYSLISISKLQQHLFTGPHATVIGTVDGEEKIFDGDWHVNIKDQDNRLLVTEFIPEIPLPIPEVGSTIKIWGITRYDLENRWWELHPVIGWEYVKK